MPVMLRLAIIYLRREFATAESEYLHDDKICRLYAPEMILSCGNNKQTAVVMSTAYTASFSPTVLYFTAKQVKTHHTNST